MAINWDVRIQKAEKFAERSREHGRKVYERYEDKREGADINVRKANLFYSNVNTLKESLFNSLPKADVSKIHKGEYNDDVARVSCIIANRVLDYEVDCAPDFQEAIELAVIDRLVPGIGQVWCSFDMEADEEGDPVVNTEKIKVEHVHWCDFLYEPARRWSKVSWGGRKIHYGKDEFVEEFGQEAYDNLGGGREEASGNSWKPEDLDKDKICVYEIWDKKTKKVYFIHKGTKDPLKEVDDPYKLAKFFPFPRPLIANVDGNLFLPQSDYHFAQDQYIQLDILYARISLLIDAVKVAGVYASDAPEIARMLTEGQNMLIPVENWAMFAEKGGVAGMIGWYPVEQIVKCLQNLQVQYESIKGLLAEISGMSDIVRGDTNQYETAKAQQIKAQFASVRLNGYQRDVAIFVQDVMAIMADLAFGLYGDEKLKEIVGELQPPDLQFVPQAAEILRSDLMRKYNVRIKADSLTQADWALEKGQRQEIVQVLGGMLGQIMPMIKDVPDMAPLAVQMVKFAISGYKGSSELEGWIDQQLDMMAKKAIEAQQNPQPPEPSPEEIKAKAEMEKLQMEAGIDQQQAQMQMQMEQQKLQFEREKNEMELRHKEAMFALEAQMRQMEMSFKQQEAMMKVRNTAISNAQSLENTEAKNEIALKQQAEKPKPKGTE